MPRVACLPLLCACATACFNPPATPLTGEGTSTTDVGTTTTVDTTTETASTTVGPTPDPDTTVGTDDSTTTDAETTNGEQIPEIQVSIEGAVVEAGAAFDIPDTVAVGELGTAVTVTVENVGTGDLQVGGVLVMGADPDHVVVDQAALAATIAPTESSTFTVTLAPQNGGLKEVVLSIANDDEDESPYELTVRGHTTENAWRQITTMDGPPGRFNAALVDLEDGRLLLFGGRNAGGTWLSDTWIFDVEASSWTEVTPPMSPPARNAHAMALAGGFVVMFGGTNVMGPTPGMADTWLFDVGAQTWAMLAPPLAPSGRFQHEMVALGGGRALLFGGRNTGSGSEIADTWIFDIAAGTWMNAAPPAPSPTSSFALAFDGDDTVTRFGGYASNSPLAETWSYTVSTNTWAAGSSVGGPGARGVLSGEYLAQGRMVVFSGKLDSCCVDPSPGTFAYDPVADAWENLMPAAEPSPRFNYGMTAVAGDNKAIVFGGLLQNTGIGTALAETWEYVGPRP